MEWKRASYKPENVIRFHERCLEEAESWHLTGPYVKEMQRQVGLEKLLILIELSRNGFRHP